MTIRHDGMKATDWSTALSSMRLEPISGVLFSDAGNGRRFLFFLRRMFAHVYDAIYERPP